MFKALKSPERLFHIAMWGASSLFASFLIGLGGLVIADLPKVEGQFSVENFADRAVLSRDRALIDQEQRVLQTLGRRKVDVEAEVGTRALASKSAQDAQNAWLTTRSVTASGTDAPRQDPELLRRTATVVEIKGLESASRERLDALGYDVRSVEQKISDAQGRIAHELLVAQPVYQRARQVKELKVFGARLALTLPLLGIATWLIVKKRRSTHWPVARGFVIFAGFTFFFELLPYLPNYGEYVRYLIGILISGVGAHCGIRWMQGYLQRRREAEQRSEQDRRANIDPIAAIQKMAAKLCPGCDRPIAAAISGEEVNHCVYCGLKLFDRCARPLVEGPGVEATGSCNVRKNAYFLHCPTCGEHTTNATPRASTSVG